MSSIDLSGRYGKEKTRTFLKKSTGILFLIALLAFYPSMMFFMVADATPSVGTLMVLLSGVSFSPACLLTIVSVWIAYYLQYYKVARYLIVLPLINIVVFYLGGIDYFWNWYL